MMFFIRVVIRGGETKLCWESQVGSILTGLVPSLHNSSKRAHNDGYVQIFRLRPLVYRDGQ